MRTWIWLAIYRYRNLHSIYPPWHFGDRKVKSSIPISVVNRYPGSTLRSRASTQVVKKWNMEYSILNPLQHLQNFTIKLEYSGIFRYNSDSTTILQNLEYSRYRNIPKYIHFNKKIVKLGIWNIPFQIRFSRSSKK